MSGRGAGSRVADGVLRLLVAAALVTDAAVHILLAPGYQLANPGGIGQGNLFYLESAAAVLVALYVLIRGSRPAYFLALVVTASALAAVLISSLVRLPAIGPIPSMYEPIWFFEKTLTTVVEGVGAVLALVGLIVGRPGARRTSQDPGQVARRVSA
ncbi:hypothetical protein [Lacisediminihabitans profunda]|uniref:Integral membrane protein n=1 Tax=Lacisediminihabitans profunda TaxID=2594790 RepID=A0A5C8UVH6_9MICO|nr:hypothetical protein [Lacisediminihabitans profunda]TXN32335.1 hypothetical protein FVP33_01570 [Lacisediminihabitans profunda]